VRDVRRALAQMSGAFYDFPTRELFNVAVTGTNGKTTTCHWTADVLGRRETLLLSTVHNPASGISHLTTPPSPVIQRLARDAVTGGMRHLVVEASSAGIAQGRVGAIDFDVCVFTNLSSEHLRHHAGMAAYRRAKLELFENMKPTATAVVNADDPFHTAIAAATSARVFTYGTHRAADLRITGVDGSSRTAGFVAAYDGTEVEVARVPHPGGYHVFNALAALGVGIVRGIPLGLLADRLAQAELLPGRGERFRRDDGVLAVVDFAHNPRSLEAVLRSLRCGTSRIIAVFGCPGDGEIEKRSGMGRAGGRWADALVLTADNPKAEDPMAIIADIRAGIVDRSTPVVVEVDRRRAIEAAVALAGAGDTVLLAGKGHETEQLVGAERLAHSDADVLRELGFVQAA
jgi:UDP-N-acetylmuramoyl-L-alanyl-D-glutamate--2,6-diaminopimelate ligase